MKRHVAKWCWGLGLVGVCGFAVAAFWLLGASRNEPRFNGEPIRYWVEQAFAYQPDPAHVKLKNFAHGLGQFRSETIWEVARMVARHPGDSILKQWYLRVLPKLPVACQNRLPKPRPDQQIRELGLLNLANYAGQQSSAAPAAMHGLVSLLRNPNECIRAEAATALGDRGFSWSVQRPLISPDPTLLLEAVRALAQATQDPSGQVRWNAVKALAALRPVSDEAVSTLIAALRDREVRRVAALSLADLHRGAPAAVPVLIEEMKKENAFGPKSVVIEALGRYGSEAEAAVPELRLLLQDRDPRIREAADKALKEIQPPEETRRP